VLEINLVWRSKIKVHSHNVCIDRSSNITLLLLLLGFPCCNARRTTQAMPVTPGFPCDTSPRPLAAGCWVFPGVGFCTLVSAASSGFQSCICMVVSAEFTHARSAWVATGPYFLFYFAVYRCHPIGSGVRQDKGPEEQEKLLF